MMLTSPMHHTNFSWTRTVNFMDRICDDLGLRWWYDPTQYEVVFRVLGGIDPVVYDLEECFGDRDSVEFRIAKSVLMRVGERNIRDMLEVWLEESSMSGWRTP